MLDSQVQTRDLPGFVETRQQLLNLKPSNRAHWVTFAVAHHINGSCEVAAKVRESLSSHERQGKLWASGSCLALLDMLCWNLPIGIFAHICDMTSV